MYSAGIFCIVNVGFSIDIVRKTNSFPNATLRKEDSKIEVARTHIVTLYIIFYKISMIENVKLQVTDFCLNRYVHLR